MLPSEGKIDYLFIYFGLFINGLPLSHIHTIDTEEACHRQMMHLSDFSKDHSSVFHTPKKHLHISLPLSTLRKLSGLNERRRTRTANTDLISCTAQKLTLSPQNNILCMHTAETMQWNNHQELSDSQLNLQSQFPKKTHFKNTRRWAVPKAAIQCGIERVVFVPLADLSFVLPQISKYCFLICSHTAQ